MAQLATYLRCDRALAPGPGVGAADRVVFQSAGSDRTGSAGRSPVRESPLRSAVALRWAHASRAGRPGQAGTGPGDVGRGYVPACISQGPPSVSLSSRVLILSVALRRASRSLGPRTSMNSSRTRLTCPGAASAWWANPASVRIAKV